MNAERTEERRKQVLDAALACFRTKGFAASTMAEICRGAGMSPGHVYHYFRSKEEIIAAIAELDRASYSEALRQIAAQDDLVRALISASDAGSNLGEFAIDGGLALEIYAESSRNDRVREAVQASSIQVSEGLISLIVRAQERGQVDPGLDPHGTATLITALFDGLTVAGLSNPSLNPDRVGAMLPLLLERFLSPGSNRSSSREVRARVSRNKAG